MILFREKENKTLKHSLLHGDDRESKKKRRLKELLYIRVQGSFKAFIASQKREEKILKHSLLRNQRTRTL